MVFSLLPASHFEIFAEEAPRDARLGVAYPQAILTTIEGRGLKGYRTRDSHLGLSHVALKAGMFLVTVGIS